MLTTQKRMGIIAIGTVALLLVPFIAMQFSNEVQWTAADFIVAGGLLLTLGFCIELIFRRAKSETNRLLLLAVLLMAFFLLWAELAVGIFGSPIAGS